MSDYTVLARKYRPETFADLVGQEAMVRTLRNAFAADRIAQAFVMTGIRGTGKTTTARIIAKGMNCIGPDGTGGPTTEPCGECEHCTSIMEGRHVDVFEMDAASRTGVGDIREIIDSVHYRAASARYKIYIIDEVHMLSINAFNALLKTLEEPPAHVKFIFATTEIRKVPVTVLSRCQRFDLRRIEPEVLMGLLRKISDAEQAQIADDALALITRAAEGSARDALSLLDQAISHGAGETSAEDVRTMLGLADRGRVMDLLDMILRGDAAGALRDLSSQYSDGADPMAILRDLAEITHWISVVKISPEAAEDPTVTPDEKSRGVTMAQELPMRVLSRLWQLLLKALEEVSIAPNAMMAAEMAIIRLTHVADLPTPEELVQKLTQSPPPSGGGGHGGGGQSGGGVPDRRHRHTLRQTRGPQFHGAAALALRPQEALKRYHSFDHVLALIEEKRDTRLLIDVESFVKLVAYRPGVIEFEPAAGAPQTLAPTLRKALRSWTHQDWQIVLHNSGGSATLKENLEKEKQDQTAKILAHPIMREVLGTFPQAKISAVTNSQDTTAQIIHDALGEVEDEWDPFEDA